MVGIIVGYCIENNNELCVCCVLHFIERIEIKSR